MNSPEADASTVANEELKADGRRLDRTTIKQLICDLAYSSPPLPPHHLQRLSSLPQLTAIRYSVPVEGVNAYHAPRSQGDPHLPAYNCRTTYPLFFYLPFNNQPLPQTPVAYYCRLRTSYKVLRRVDPHIY